MSQPPLKKDKMVVVMSLKTSDGFLWGSFPIMTGWTANVKDTCNMFNIMRVPAGFAYSNLRLFKTFLRPL